MSRLRSGLVAVAAATALVIPVVAGPVPAQAAGTVRSAVSLTGPTSGAYGATVTLRGTLWRYGTSTKIAGAVVYLQRAYHNQKTWANLKSARTSTTGTFAFSITQGGAFDYRVYYAGSPTYTGALSNVHYPATLQKVVLRTLATTNQSSGALRATGSVYPAPPSGSPVVLQRWTGTAWQTIGSGRSTGSTSVAVTATQPGSVATYRLVAPTRYPYGAGASNAAVLHHYVWRGAFKRPVLRTGGNGTFTVLPPADSPERLVAYIEGPARATVYADLDTRGCQAVNAQTVRGNEGDGYTEVVVSGDGGLYERGDLAPGPNQRVDLRGYINELPSVRYQVTDSTSTTGLSVFAGIHLLCKN